jgi:membrane associated rhomboid family serine protease
LIPLKDNIPTSRLPILTVALIAINVAVFVWQLGHSSDRGSASSPELARAGVSSQDEIIYEYGAIPRELTEPGTYCAPHAQADRIECGSRVQVEADTDIRQAPWWLTIITSMFMHGGILHIAGNMLFLWIFGNNIEDSMGRARFLLFYLLAGAVAVYAQALLDSDATVPTIGASGAVSGILGAYLLLHPRARVLTLVIIIFFVTFIEIPALIMLGLWFVLQALPAFGQLATQELGAEGGIAYLAHVGGFLFGLATIKLFADRHRRGESTVSA